MMQEQTHSPEIALEVSDLVVDFGKGPILDGLNLTMAAGEILGVVGGSGTGKSVLMRTILGLIRPQAGQVHIMGNLVVDGNRGTATRSDLWHDVGVLFQQGALFSSLTVAENIMMPMRESLRLSKRLMKDLAMMKLQLVGLDTADADKYPAALSGGMIKRAALARALALDPALLFVDEPTSGLDPISAEGFDELIEELRDTLGISVYMVTHDLDSLHRICDRVAVLSGGKVLVQGTLAELHQQRGEWIESYFGGERGSKFNSPRVMGGTP